MSVPGGFSPPKPADKQIQDKCDVIPEQIPMDLTELTALYYQSRIVGGIDYVVQAYAGDRKYIQVKISELPDLPPKLTSYEMNEIPVAPFR